MKIRLSEMSGKLKGIQAINTNPLSNTFCKAMYNSGKKNIICASCYSCKMLNGYRKNCIPAFEYNSIALSNGDITDADIPKIKSDIVRIHAHGELINDTHLYNIVKIVEKYPEKTFSLYTKRKDIIDNIFCERSIPINLILVYSNPVIDTPLTTIPNKFDKVFNVCKTTNKNNINCGALNCNTCRKCYDKTKENIIYEAIK